MALSAFVTLLDIVMKTVPVPPLEELLEMQLTREDFTQALFLINKYHISEKYEASFATLNKFHPYASRGVLVCLLHNLKDDVPDALMWLNARTLPDV